MKNLLFTTLLFLISSTLFAQEIKNIKELSWLLGDWEGKSGNSSFFEGYELHNDTLIIIKYYTDKSCTNIKGEGRIFLENGEIYHTSGRSKWKVTEKKKDTWCFSPIVNASNSFNWIFVNKRLWKAELITAGRTTTYPLERINQ
ncbi:MAG: hypothetical protein ACNS60_15685 [Candidatus Cyclobacteriaceae bacterium M2_1C_046]